MQFTQRLHERIRRGEITCSVRIWMRPHVKVGGRYPVAGGEIEVDRIVPIGFDDITPDLARESGFAGVVDLLKTAKHGRGENVYLVKFHFVAPETARPRARSSSRNSKVRFEAELIEGHKGVTVVLVPFDPEALWSQKPVRLAGRRHGWLINAAVNRVRFDGYIGDRWGRFFIIIDEALRKRAKVGVGDVLKMAVEPTETAQALERAFEQSKSTTQPKKARADATVRQARQPR